MGTEQDPQPELSGILEKRRQSLKFQWQTYSFKLAGTKLSYYKMGGSNDKDAGELGGVIDMREVQSLSVANPVGSRFPIEVTLRSGKVVLLASNSHSERARWMTALQDKILLSKRRRSSDCLVVRDKPTALGRGINEWMNQSSISSPLPENPESNEDLDVLEDMDSFIDKTFNGITFNRQSRVVKKETPQPVPNHASRRKAT